MIHRHPFTIMGRYVQRNSTALNCVLYLKEIGANSRRTSFGEEIVLERITEFGVEQKMN